MGNSCTCCNSKIENKIANINDIFHLQNLILSEINRSLIIIKEITEDCYEDGLLNFNSEKHEFYQRFTFILISLKTNIEVAENTSTRSDGKADDEYDEEKQTYFENLLLFLKKVLETEENFDTPRLKILNDRMESCFNIKNHKFLFKEPS